MGRVYGVSGVYGVYGVGEVAALSGCVEFMVFVARLVLSAF